ncbi:MAG: hypothetical protein ABIR31_00045 [Ginsengibacter sp.]
MSVKKIITFLSIALCLSFSVPVSASVTDNGTPTPKEILANKIETRLVEINKMDKSNLTKVEKKELRKEVKELKKQANKSGIYLSVGAIIIIILLLILLL